MCPSIRPPRVHPLLVLVFGILAASTASVFIRYAQQHAPSLVIAAARLTLASIILAPIAATRYRQSLKTFSKRELALALLAGFFLALHFATWISSLEYTSVASSVVFVTTTPLWVALLAPFTVKEQLTRLMLPGMIMALMGGVVIGLGDVMNDAATPGKNPLLGDMLAIAGALAAACYVLIGRRLRGDKALIPYIFVVYSMAAIVLIGFMFIAEQRPWGYPPITYGWFLLLALIPQLLGHSSFNWALRYLSAAQVSTTLLGEPIGSIILAYSLLGEVPSLAKLMGVVLILGGIYIFSRSQA